MSKRIIIFGLLLMIISSVFVGCGMEEKDPSEMHVAMITDSGDITDQSFNQQIYEACLAYCEKNNIDFTYKKPENATTADRVAMVDLAVAEGYNVIVCVGFDFAKTLTIVTEKYPDIKFISGDIDESDLISAAVGQKYYAEPDQYRLEDYCYTDNLYISNYKTNISGFMAGYAAVKSGYKKLGFIGGQPVPGVLLYGYGYLQGIDTAAKELGITDSVVVEYAYAGQFFGSAEITAVTDTWYHSGTEIVFACGGSVYTSVSESAAKYKGKVIGVDTDQSALINQYGKKMTFTSALKRLDVTVNSVLSSIKNNQWNQYKGKIENVGLLSRNDVSKNAVGLPLDSTLWNAGFAQSDYKHLAEQMYTGEIKISDSVTNMPQVSVKVKERQGTIL